MLDSQFAVILETSPTDAGMVATVVDCWKVVPAGQEHGRGVELHAGKLLVSLFSLAIISKGSASAEAASIDIRSDCGTILDRLWLVRKEWMSILRVKRANLAWLGNF